jgi:hypothetical protein
MEETKFIRAHTQPRERREQFTDCKIVFWNVLLTLFLSSLVLAVYLKRILFDF